MKRILELIVNKRILEKIAISTPLVGGLTIFGMGMYSNIERMKQEGTYEDILKTKIPRKDLLTHAGCFYAGSGLAALAWYDALGKRNHRT
ncbi:MAG: hypothetical protein V1659_02805 [Candidatus Woesearchaeota archaeon]